MAFVVTLCISIAGCTSEEGRAATASRALAQSLAKPAVSGPPRETSPAPGVPKLYVDASQSMAGFVGCEQRRTFDGVLARIATDLGITHVLLFGEPLTGPSQLFLEAPLDRRIYCPATYNRRYNPDFALVEAVARDSSTPANVYLTDGVQSAADAAAPSPSVRALQRWITSGHALAIIAFRGTFSGRAWSEEAQRWIGTPQLSDRPFYAFVFGRTEADVAHLLEMLSPEVRQAGVVMRITGAFPHCTIEPTRQHYAKMDTPPWVMFPPSLATRLASAPGEVGTYECRVASDFPLETVLANVAATYRPWTGSRFVDTPAELPAGVAIVTDSVVTYPTGSRTVLRARIPADPDTRFGFYALELRARPGRLRAAVDSLSTETDVAPSNYRRTYRFAWMLEHLVRSEFASRAVQQPYFLTVQYR